MHSQTSSTSGQGVQMVFNPVQLHNINGPVAYSWLYSGEGGDKFLFGRGVSCLGLFKAVLSVKKNGSKFLKNPKQLKKP